MNRINRILDNRVPNVIGFKKIFKSSVVIPLIDIDGKLHVIFEVRGSRLKVQPGEISFPGGKIEHGENPADAAVREFCEELECKPSDIKIQTMLDYYINMSKGLIYTFIGKVNPDINLEVHNTEVEEIFTVPLSFFLKNEPEIYVNEIKTIPDENFPYEEMNISRNYYNRNQSMEVCFYRYKKYVIWGITANIMKNFVDIVRN